MRYYRIEFTSPSGAPLMPSSLAGIGDTAITSLLPNGQNNPAALNVEFDFPLANFANPEGNAILQISGLSVRDLTESFELDGANITVYGGMSKGLPLANPAQQGLILKGVVLNPFGNWIGTEQNIAMTFYAGSGTPSAPLNYILDWHAGQTLADALRITLATALPNATLNINISPRLVQNHDEPGYHGTLEALAGVVYLISRSIISDPTYPGVGIAFNGSVVNVSDRTVPTAPKAIAYTDLIGQPTFIAPSVISVKTVLRGDILQGDILTLPRSAVTNSIAAASSFAKNDVTLSGNYFVQNVHHYGNFRQPDASSWSTVFEMTPQPAAN